MLINAQSSFPANLVAKTDTKHTLKTVGLAVTWVAINALCFAYLANQLQKKYELIDQRVTFVNRDYRYQGTYTSTDFAVDCGISSLLGFVAIPTITAIVLEDLFKSLR